jgi:hypothetical protein
MTNRCHEQQIQILLNTNDGYWPQTPKGYIRLLWKLGISCQPDPMEETASLRVGSDGNWFVLYNQDLPDETLCAFLVHEASEYLSRMALLEEDGEPAPAASLTEEINLTDYCHEVATSVVKRWCDLTGKCYYRVISVKKVFRSGPHANFGYFSNRPEMERIPLDEEDGSSIGKQCE